MFIPIKNLMWFLGRLWATFSVTGLVMLLVGIKWKSQIEPDTLHAKTGYIFFQATKKILRH